MEFGFDRVCPEQQVLPTAVGSAVASDLGLSLVALGWPTTVVLRCLQLDSSVPVQEWGYEAGAAAVSNQSKKMMRFFHITSL